MRDPAAIGAAIAEMSVAGLLAEPGAIAAVVATADDLAT
jgi:hypothetical protein